jgi:hypothetical protein
MQCFAMLWGAFFSGEMAERLVGIALLGVAACGGAIIFCAQLFRGQFVRVHSFKERWVSILGIMLVAPAIITASLLCNVQCCKVTEFLFLMVGCGYVFRKSEDLQLYSYHWSPPSLLQGTRRHQGDPAEI